MLAAIVQLVTKTDQLRVATELTAQQQPSNLFANRTDVALERAPLDFAGFVLTPVLEQLPVLSHQVVPHSFDLTIGRINQFLKVSLQVSPTPLKPLPVQVHLGAITVQDDPLVISHQSQQRLATSIGEDSKHREHGGDRHPQPRFLLFLFGGRLIDVELFLLGQFAAEFFIGNRHGLTDQVLDFDGPSRTAGDIQQIAQEREKRRCDACFDGNAPSTNR